jgi:hypothetical protein
MDKRSRILLKIRQKFVFLVILFQLLYSNSFQTDGEQCAQKTVEKHF